MNCAMHAGLDHADAIAHRDTVPESEFGNLPPAAGF